MTQDFSSRREVHQLIELVNQGEPALAERRCRKALKRNPMDVNMVALLGAILLKTRQYEEAEQKLRQAIELQPEFAKPHEDLGVLLVDRYRAEEALPFLEKAVALDPSLETAFFNLGKALLLLGRGSEADRAFEASFELNPSRKILALAAEHHKAGRLEQAREGYRQVLGKDPGNVDALRLLGDLMMDESRFDEAARLFRRAVQQAPDFVGAIIDMGRALKEQSRYQDAIACFRRALELEPDNVQAQFLLAGTLSPAALTFEAIEAFERTLELRPTHAGAKLGLGHMLKTVGRQEEAIQAYRDCIRLRPESGATYWSLANLKTYRLDDEDIEEMKARVEAGGLTPESEVNFLFALAKAHEDRGDFDTAWHYYREGNGLRRANEYYDPVAVEVMNDAIIEVFDRELLERVVGIGHDDPAPIFVVGLPRSGSTLIEQVLASHSQVEGTSELPYVGHLSESLNRNRADGVTYPKAVCDLEDSEWQALGRRYLDAARMHRIEGTPRFIDKMPNNFPAIGFIKAMLPEARIIDARRHPLDSCLSCYRQLFARGQPFTYDLSDIGEYFLEYQRLMDHWHEVMPGQVLTVQYEEMVTDTERWIRRLVEFCGLPWEDGCARFWETDRPVRTASSEQVRQPVYTGSVNFWRRYASELGELIEVLEPVRDRYRQYESINR